MLGLLQRVLASTSEDERESSEVARLPDQQFVAEATGDGKLAEEAKEQARQNENTPAVKPFGNLDRLTVMPRYFFHLMGELPAHDVLGHECANEKEAEEHANFIAHRVGTEKPSMVKEGNFISTTDEDGKEVAQIPLASVIA